MAETLQIRNVPAELHTAIAEHARAQGLTISQYLLRRLAQIEGKPELAEALDTHRERSSGYKHARRGTATELLADDRHR